MTVPLNPSIVGQAEKVHTVILSRALAGTGLDETQWITLNQSIAIDPADRTALLAHVVSATKFDAALVESAISRLNERDLLEGAQPTELGRTLVTDVRASLAPILARAYGQVSDEDSRTASKVLITITAALSQELGA
ncbi:hypothetical protein ACFXHA_12770 [Nocardia sp. NPDC059240]|uniref:hypothetical protein n=1 Tax=Nocardia sp. NPDC059240 TaxID=3346786 RepID=UPI0036CFB53E